MNGLTMTGDQVLVVLAVGLTVVLVAMAGRVLLAAAVIAGIQWVVIHFLSGNDVVVWVALGVPALLAGYTLADTLTGRAGLGSNRLRPTDRRRHGGDRR